MSLFWNRWWEKRTYCNINFYIKIMSHATTVGFKLWVILQPYFATLFAVLLKDFPDVALTASLDLFLPCFLTKMLTHLCVSLLKVTSKRYLKCTLKGQCHKTFDLLFYPLGLKDTQMVKETKNCINVRPSVLKSRDIFFWAPGQRRVRVF